MTKIIIPGSSANMGPGFDCLAVALDIYLEAEFYEVHIDNFLEMEINGYGKDHLPESRRNLIYQAYAKAFQYLDKKPKGIKMKITNNIPISRGLGSSSTAIVCGLVMANHIMNNILSEKELVKLACEMEGHSDNVTAAIIGGFSVSNIVNGDICYNSFPSIRKLKCAVIIPNYELQTKKAREVLPSHIMHHNAVQNVANVGLMISSFVYDDIDLFAACLQDYLHEPYRENLVKGFGFLKEQAFEYGFIGTTISGSGPTIMLYYEEGTKVDFAKLEMDFSEKYHFDFQILKLNIVDHGYLEVK